MVHLHDPGGTLNACTPASNTLQQDATYHGHIDLQSPSDMHGMLDREIVPKGVGAVCLYLNAVECCAKKQTISPPLVRSLHAGLADPRIDLMMSLLCLALQEQLH